MHEWYALPPFASARYIINPSLVLHLANPFVSGATPSISALKAKLHGNSLGMPRDRKAKEFFMYYGNSYLLNYHLKVINLLGKIPR